MRVKFLGTTSTGGNCPTLYATDRDSYAVQGWRVPGSPITVKIPHGLLGFAEPETFIGATMTDAGDGTFELNGVPVTDPEALSDMTIADDETCVEVAKMERTFYGAAASR